jgi:hypothetical protein
MRDQSGSNLVRLLIVGIGLFIALQPATFMTNMQFGSVGTAPSAPFTSPLSEVAGLVPGWGDFWWGMVAHEETPPPAESEPRARFTTGGKW